MFFLNASSQQVITESETRRPEMRRGEQTLLQQASNMQFYS